VALFVTTVKVIGWFSRLVPDPVRSATAAAGHAVRRR
jgi:hypothetical protein